MGGHQKNGAGRFANICAGAKKCVFTRPLGLRKEEGDFLTELDGSGGIFFLLL
jgi:hypothetical protein